MKKLFATLAALAALALGVSLPAIAQNPDTPPVVADSTVTVDTGVLVVEVPAPSDSVVVADPLLPVPEEVTDPEVAGPEADTQVDPVIPLIETTPACKIDRQLANHLSIGVSAGFDGIGGQLALSLGPHFDVRAGYSYLNSIERTPRELAEGSFGSVIPSEDDLSFEAGDTKVNLYDVPIGLTINNFGPNILFDYFPWKDASFHLTAGAFISKGDFVTLTADVSEQLDPEDYGNLGIEFKNVEVTTDPEGVIRFDWRASAVRPYFGLGFGRPVSMKHRVGVSLDMGLVVLGSKGFYTYRYNGLSGLGVKEDVELSSDALDNEDHGIIDKISGLPVLPMMKFTINVRLF